MAIGKFGNKAAPTSAATTKAKPAQKRRSRFGTVALRDNDREPMPEVGEYLLRWSSAEEVLSESKPGLSWFKALFEICEITDIANKDNIVASECHAIGDTVCALHATVGDAAIFGREDTKRMVMAVAGYESEEEYDAFDPEGFYIDCVQGIVTDYKMGLEGRLVRARVTARKPDNKGSYYRSYEWQVVPEDEQDAAQQPTE